LQAGFRQARVLVAAAEAKMLRVRAVERIAEATTSAHSLDEPVRHRADSPRLVVTQGRCERSP
jgi:hypothetical protein